MKQTNRLASFEPASASRTAGRSRSLDNFINGCGEGPAIAAPVLLSCFASGFLGLGFGFVPRERGRLSLRGSYRLLQQLPQSFDLFLQYFILSLEPRYLFCGMLFCHIDKLTASQM